MANGDKDFLRQDAHPEKQEREEEERDIFASYCNKWLAVNSVRLKVSSCAKYRTDIEKHIIPFFGEKTIDEINSDTADHFTRHLLCEKKLSERTVRNILTLFHSIFQYAGRRSGKGFSELEIVYPKDHKKSIRILDQEEEKALSLVLADKMDLSKFGVYMALRTGLRIGEVCALKWKDISLNTDTISICRTVQRIRCLEERAATKTKIVVGAPKSDSSSRIIPLMPDLASLCTRFYQGNPETYILTGSPCCMEPRKLQRRLKIYTEKCQMKGVHFHTLRHTFATRCIEAGFDTKTLSEILGHSNISITLNQYVHPDLNKKRRDMSRLKMMIQV